MAIGYTIIETLFPDTKFAKHKKEKTCQTLQEDKMKKKIGW